MAKFYIVVALLLLSVCCLAQVDTEFWFAPPEVTVGHGDRPIYLRISTLDKSADVKVSQPARNNILLASVTVAANTTHTLNLTSQISSIEPNSPAAVLKTGIKITSSAPITAYYEVGAPFNTDIFSLKGRNALGNEFVIPGQNYYSNSSIYNPTPYFSFDIVATSNNTVIRVYPTKPITGHVNDTLITIKLNAGETYSFRKTTTSALDNPVGTRIESNKPIAVTLKDDSVINNTCHDILGDQLVPVKVAGQEYVVLKGFLAGSEFLFITATADNTEIFIDGNSNPVVYLNAGEVYRLPIYNQSTHIFGSKTVYAMHVTGFGCELGMAILPSINCKGSTQIGFSRTTSEFFGLNVLVRKEGISHFKLNGSSSLVPSHVFSAVPGTNDKWYSAQLSFSTNEIPVGQASLISNEQYSFQVGIINGDAFTSCRYGYFSAFSTLFIGDDFAICEGESAVIDAGPGKESYLWSTGDTGMSINVNSPGTYWVRVEREQCVLYDTIKVDVKKGKIDLGPDTQFCEGDEALVDGKENFSWLWSDGSHDRYLKTELPGKYWVSVFDYTGCEASDTIFLTTKPKPSIDLGNDIVKCPEENVLLNATSPGSTYQWENGNTSAIRTVKEAGIYWCKATSNGCSAIDSVIVTNLPGPVQDSIFGSPVVCPFVNGVEYHVEETEDSSYEWFVEGGTITTNEGQSIGVDWLGDNSMASVKSLITDSMGCKGDTLYYPVRINVRLEPIIPQGPDTLCFNKNIDSYTTSLTNGSLYNWFIEGGNIIEGQGTYQVTVNWQEGLNKLWVTESSVTVDTVCEGTSPIKMIHVFEDESSITLNYVSVDTLDESRVSVNWNVAPAERVRGDSVYLFKKTNDVLQWEEARIFTSNENSFKDQGNNSDTESYDYYVEFNNRCDELMTSNIHNTIRLLGVADTIANVIQLSWNHYQGWRDGVDHYEVWRKLDDDSGYKFFSNVSSGENNFSAIKPSDAFVHQYVVRAIERNGIYESWSNNVQFSFENMVFIPNVFTPNGDPDNQYFEITKIELYENSDLLVMNRWGKAIFHSRGYKNDWDGGDLSTGVYFYILNLNRGGKVMRGTISILR